MATDPGGKTAYGISEYQEEMANLRLQVRYLKSALEKIRSDYGRTCDLCAQMDAFGHDACKDSRRSWQLADETLRELAKEDGEWKHSNKRKKRSTGSGSASTSRKPSKTVGGLWD